jgi:hypothetical protein
MPNIDKPTRGQIGRIAENQPSLLNLLVAYFVFEWQEVRAGSPSHGIDQIGETAVIPDFVGSWGVDSCVHYLLLAPSRRDADGPGYLSEWLKEISR